MKITIVGAGMGNEACLTAAGKGKITGADLVLTTQRLFEQLGHLNPNSLCKEIGELKSFIEANQARYKTICILASGDVGFYSIAKTLTRELPGFGLELVSGISSLQYFTAKLGLGYEDIHVVSLHGRAENILAHCAYHPKVFALTGGSTKATQIIATLVAGGLAKVQVTVGENLGAQAERLITATAQELQGQEFESLAVMLIQNPHFVNPGQKIEDYAFIRGKVPMTKEAVRTLSIGYLQVLPTDVVGDIGAGTGAVAIELARKAYASTVYALEKKAEGVALIRANIAKFGAYNVQVLEALAPQGLEALPPLDKVFIGGSSGNLPQIITAVLAKNPQTRIVLNAVTLETLHQGFAVMEAAGLQVEVVCINVARTEKLGGYHLMKAENPIYIMVGEKPTVEIEE